MSLEDVTKATEEIFGSDDSNKVAKDSVDGPSSSRNSILDRDSSSGLGRSASSVGAPSATSSLSLTTATTTTTTASSISSSDMDVVGQREDRSITSGYRSRRALEDRNDVSRSLCCNILKIVLCLSLCVCVSLSLSLSLSLSIYIYIYIYLCNNKIF